MERQYSKLQIWLLASRPKTLWAAVTPVVIGAVLAIDEGSFHLLSAFAVLLSATLIQIGTNLANDLFDFKEDVDSGERLGPLRVTQEGLVSPKLMATATTVVFTFAFLLGIYLVYRGGWPIVIIGLSAILFGILYTGGPFPLGYNGLGDIFVLIYFGPVAVAGTYYLMTLQMDWTAVLAGLPAGMLSTALLTVNNLRDIETDKRSGKKTLQVRFGRRFTQGEYLIMVFVAIMLPLLYFLITGRHVWVLITILALPVAVILSHKVLTVEGRALNQVLAGTGRLLALYGLLFSIGWLL